MGCLAFHRHILPKASTCVSCRNSLAKPIEEKCYAKGHNVIYWLSLTLQIIGCPLLEMSLQTMSNKQTQDDRFQNACYSGLTRACAILRWMGIASTWYYQFSRYMYVFGSFYPWVMWSACQRCQRWICAWFGAAVLYIWALDLCLFTSSEHEITAGVCTFGGSSERPSANRNEYQKTSDRHRKHFFRHVYKKLY